jgi:Gpi18-like mannosyltransferase
MQIDPSINGTGKFLWGMDKDKKKSVLIVIFIVLTTIALRGLLLYYSNFTADDSFITFRYAENLASGKGFVYNQGERVLGTTTPLYTLILALVVKLGLPAVLLARLINIGADCISGTLIFLLLKRFNSGTAALAAFSFVVFPRVMVWSISGMETSLYMLFIAASLFFYYREKYDPASLFLGLAFLTRVDGAVLGIAMMIHFIIIHRKFPARLVLGAFAVVLPWLVFSFWYFGSPLPNSVLGKRALYSATEWETPQWKIFWEFLFLKVKIGWPLLLLALTGGFRILTKFKPYAIIVIWTVLYFLFFFFGQTKMHIWYYVPFYLGYLILVAFGAEAVFEKTKTIIAKSSVVTSYKTNILSRITMVLISAVLVFAVLVYYQQLRRTVKLVAIEQVALEGIQKEMGFWLRDNTLPTDTVCAEDIGYLGYYSGRYILDQDGLVSPQAIPFNRKKDRLGLLKEYRPAYFLIGLSGPYFSQVLESEWLKRNYRMAAAFDPRSISLDRARVCLEGLKLYGCKYEIYKRLNEAY